MERCDYLVVGAGFAGSVCAERLASAGKAVLLIDERDHVGGNAHDAVNADGVLEHRYGAHIFHTSSQAVVRYLSRFTAWRPYRHRTRACVNGRLVPMPMNRTTLAAFGDDMEAARAALIEPYTRKQWGPWADQLSPSVLARIRPRDTNEDGYFADSFQQMPVDGYTPMFQRMLNHTGITVRLGVSYEAIRPALSPGVTVIWTGPIDRYFRYCLGRLPYRSATFRFHTFRRPRYQPVGVVNYPSLAYPFTRIVEFKHLTGQRHPCTTIAVEYPQADGDPYWPVLTAASAELAAQYRDLGQRTPGVHFVGRLGTFRYLDMHQAVSQALKLSTSLLQKEIAA